MDNVHESVTCGKLCWVRSCMGLHVAKYVCVVWLVCVHLPVAEVCVCVCVCVYICVC